MQLSEIRDQARFETMKENTVEVTDAQLDIIVNQGYHEISVFTDWPWLYASTTITLVADQANYALPADYQKTIALIDDDNDETIPYLSPELYWHRVGNDTGNSSATPDFFTIYNDDINLTPIPSSADTNRLTLKYYKTITELSADGDEPVFHDAFHYALVEYTKWRLWEREEFFQEGQRAQLSYRTYLLNMQDFYNNQVNHTPAVWGDGMTLRRGDPNIPSLWRV